MQILTKVALPFRGSLLTLDLFSYSTKGIPGIEIVGLGKIGREMKEKLIYLTKIAELKIPLKRYVLCIELGEYELKVEELKFIEFPLLLSYWALSENLPCTHLDDCISAGTISPRQIITIPNYFYDTSIDHHLKIMALRDATLRRDQLLLDLRELFEGKRIGFNLVSYPLNNSVLKLSRITI